VQWNKDLLAEVGLKGQNANSSIKASCGMHFEYHWIFVGLDSLKIN
jgi:hypothetical protein